MMRDSALALGGVPLESMLASLRARDPSARAFWAYDLDAFAARAARLRAALAPLGSHAAYALKANGPVKRTAARVSLTTSNSTRLSAPSGDGRLTVRFSAATADSQPGKCPRRLRR